MGIRTIVYICRPMRYCIAVLFLLNICYASDHYDFSKVRVIKNMGVFKIRSVLTSEILFDKQEGDLTDKVLYDRDSLNFNFDGFYRCKFLGIDTFYYFRFGLQVIWQGETIFKNVVWSPRKPPLSTGIAEIEIVSVPFVQEGSKTVCTIGDSKTWWNKGEYYRKFLNQAIPDFVFIGSRTDIYGYGHEGEGGNSTLDVLKRMKYIPQADIYIIMIGTNDRKDAVYPVKTVENIEAILAALKAKRPGCSIYLLSITPCVDTKRDNYNQEINRMLRSKCECERKGVTILDSDSMFRARQDWSNYLIDGLHPNEKGYHLLVELISARIK